MQNVQFYLEFVIGMKLVITIVVIIAFSHIFEFILLLCINSIVVTTIPIIPFKAAQLNNIDKSGDQLLHWNFCTSNLNLNNLCQLCVRYRHRIKNIINIIKYNLLLVIFNRVSL